ncbi:MAG: hypothetical protein EOP56_18705 [Sphingobacteriales bacterium]|nr:MAG: hypothetical protein EOP56_18705 [Sphingobacteriales bacterium]
MNSSSLPAVLIFGTLLFTLFAFFAILYVILQKRKQYQHKLEKQKLSHQYQSELLQSRIEVQEQAFRYFSEEIHDNIGQVLSLVKLQLYKIARNTKDEGTLKDIQNSTELMTKAITDLRNLSHTANDGYILNAELSEVIKKELNYVSSAKSIACNFNSDGVPYSLGQERNLLIFRIIQESIANALKHGNPDELNIHVKYYPERVTVSVKDNGVGFDTNENKSSEAGLGLNNMNLRAALLKGKLDITSEKEKGTTITLDIPAEV